MTFTATVTSSGSPVSTGTVEFANGGTDISGCEAAALNASGVAACTTSFTTEGDDSITAAYGGTSSFAASNGALTQEVDRHTVVSGSTYSNPGQIAIPTSVPCPPATFTHARFCPSQWHHRQQARSPSTTSITRSRRTST